MQPIDYTQGLGGFAQGFNTAAGVADRFAQQQQLAQQQQAQAQQVEKANQLQSQLESAYNAGDVDALNLLSIQAPEISSRLLGAIEKKTGAKQDEIVSLAEKITYNPDNAMDYLTERVQTIQARKGDPSDTVRMIQELRKDPKKFLNDTKMMFAMTAPKEKYDRYKDFSGQTEVEPMTAYQQEMVRQKDTEMDLRKLEIEEKRLERQLKRETDTLKKEELQQKIEENKRRSDEAKKTKESDALSAYQSGQDTLDLVDRIKTHEGLKDFVGAKGASSLFGLKDTPIAGTQAAAVSGLIDTLSSQNFLNAVKQMQGMGALSDAEGKKLASAVTSLDPNMPEKEFLSNLNTVETLTRRAMDKAKSKMPSQEAKVEPKQTPKYNVGQIARNPQTGEVLVFTESGWVKQ